MPNKIPTDDQGDGGKFINHMYYVAKQYPPAAHVLISLIKQKPPVTYYEGKHNMNSQTEN
jgi:hypothetical protein